MSGESDIFSSATDRFSIYLRRDNHAPVIREDWPTEVTAGTSCTHVMQADDADRDELGYPYKQTDINGSFTITNFYDGELYATTDADHNRTGFEYDRFGSMTKVTQSSRQLGTDTMPGSEHDGTGTGTSTSFDYNAFGDLVETVDADGNARSIFYDQAGNQTGTSFTWTDPNDSSVTQTLTTEVGVGPDGQVDWTLDASGNASVTLYDDLGRASTQISDADLTEPDAEGRRSYVAGSGRETVSTFDQRGLTIQTRTESVDELGQTVYLVSRTTYLCSRQVGSTSVPGK